MKNLEKALEIATLDLIEKGHSKEEIIEIYKSEKFQKYVAEYKEVLDKLSKSK